MSGIAVARDNVVESTRFARDDEVAIFKYSSYRPQSVQVAGRTISKYSVALLVIVLTGLLLRVYGLGVQSLWIDELWSVMVSKMSLSQTVQFVAGQTFSRYC